MNKDFLRDKYKKNVINKGRESGAISRPHDVTANEHGVTQEAA
jgi:hypothetical protein